MEYRIISAAKSGTYKGKFGEIQKWMLVLEKDGEQIAAELSQKMETPAPSGTITGSIEDTPYGNKFKKEQPFTPGGTNRNDPEVQSAIIRQNSLTNAVAYCTAKANLMDKKEALKFLTGKEVLNVATYFAAYSQGKVVASDPELPSTGESDGVIDISDLPNIDTTNYDEEE